MKNVWEYSFKPEGKLDYTPGQYVAMYIPHVIDKRGPSRTFSLTSLPKENYITFVTHYESNSKKRSTYKQCLSTLKKGSVVRVNDAMGDLVLPKSSTVPLVFVAGGMGIASFISMMRYLLDTKEHREVSLFYCFKNERDMMFQSLLENFSFTYKKLIKRPERLTVSSIKAFISNDSLIYLSGSQTFVEDLRKDFAAHDIRHDRIVFDYFDGYAEL